MAIDLAFLGCQFMKGSNSRCIGQGMSIKSTCDQNPLISVPMHKVIHVFLFPSYYSHGVSIGYRLTKSTQIRYYATDALIPPKGMAESGFYLIEYQKKTIFIRKFS